MRVKVDGRLCKSSSDISLPVFENEIGLIELISFLLLLFTKWINHKMDENVWLFESSDSSLIVRLIPVRLGGLLDARLVGLLVGIAEFSKKRQTN